MYLNLPKTWNISVILLLLLPRVAWTQAIDSGPYRRVTFQNISNITQLIALEERWLSENYPGYALSQFFYDPKRLSNSIPITGSVYDTAKIKFGNKNATITFTCNSIPNPSSIRALWQDYLKLLMSEKEGRLAGIQFGRFRSQVALMTVDQVVPYLIEQLSDERPIRIQLVSGGTKVKDLIVFEFLSKLAYGNSGELVFPDLKSDPERVRVRQRAVAEKATSQLKQWWDSRGRIMIERKQLRWHTNANGNN